MLADEADIQQHSHSAGMQLQLRRMEHCSSPVGGGDHLHLGDLPINDICWQIELVDHAQGDGATAWLHSRDPKVCSDLIDGSADRSSLLLKG